MIFKNFSKQILCSEKLRNQRWSSSEEEHSTVIHIESIDSKTSEPVSKRTLKENKSVKRLEKPIGEKFVEKSAETVDKNKKKFIR